METSLIEDSPIAGIEESIVWIDGHCMKEYPQVDESNTFDSSSIADSLVREFQRENRIVSLDDKMIMHCGETAGWQCFNSSISYNYVSNRMDINAPVNFEIATYPIFVRLRIAEWPLISIGTTVCFNHRYSSIKDVSIDGNCIS